MSDVRPLRVGIVGAGPWASLVHAPLFAAHPRTELSGVWARRPEAGRAVAAANGTRFVDDFDQLCEQSDALTFCVPPDVQVALAARGARAGRALLLEKPVALDLDDARTLAEVVDATGVVAQLVLTWRYASVVRTFLDQLTSEEVRGGRGLFVNNALRDATFGTPWRREHGPLWDLGPHVLDLLDASVGRIVDVTARGDRVGWISLILEHEGHRISEASLFGHCAVPGGAQGIEVFTDSTVHRLDTATTYDGSTFATLANEFVDAVALGQSPPLDVHHGVRLQEVLARAARQLR